VIVGGVDQQQIWWLDAWYTTSGSGRGSLCRLRWRLLDALPVEVEVEVEVEVDLDLGVNAFTTHRENTIGQ
jgi:hypothetical protein